ncbi:MAG TPA: hypothetical protein VGM22_20895 [Methylomirabilota bacterium]|jgi:hypothetical protein
MARIAMAVALMLALVSPAAAQNFAPQPPPPARPGGPAATICSTEWGWCPIQTVVLPGGGCYCFVPPSTWLAGSARYWPYEGPVSPYLNPHTAPPSTLK